MSLFYRNTSVLNARIAPLLARPAAAAALSRPLAPCTSKRHSSSASSKLPQGPLHLLTLSDLTPPDLHSILRTSLKFKRLARSGAPLPQSLASKHLAVIFSKRSTRTRLAAETAMQLLGGHAIFLSAQDVQLGGGGESVRDTAMVVSRMVDGVFARVHAHSELMDFKAYASIPVINALSDDHHPTQALADLLTMYEALYAREKDTPISAVPTEFDPSLLQGRKVAWVGDASNVCHSLLVAGGKMGMVVSVATPPGYGPKPSIIADLINVPIVTTHPDEAVKNADFVSTDVFVSMGQEAEAVARKKAFDGFKVTTKLMQLAKPGAGFLHCLPRKGEEVEDDVFYGRHSLVWEQAENRKWTTAAVLHHALGVGKWIE